MIKYGARVGMKFKSRVRDIASLNGIWELKTDAYDIGVHNLWYKDAYFCVPDCWRSCATGFINQQVW